MKIAHRPIPPKYNDWPQNFRDRKYQKEEGKILTKERASYIVDILRTMQYMPDVIGPSSCGQYIFFHYFWRKDTGQIRFHIDVDASYIIFYIRSDIRFESPHPIKPNTVKEVSYRIDDLTYARDGASLNDKFLKTFKCNE